MHLTPKFVFRLNESTCYSKHLGEKIFEFGWILDFLRPFKVALEVFHDRVLGSLERRSLMTSTQEPNTMASPSALCICSTKWGTKLIVPIYFGTKTCTFCFKIFSFSSLGSELSFDWEDSEINFARARSKTVNSRLRALRAICNIQATMGKSSLRTSCLYIRVGKRKTGKKTRGLLVSQLDMVISSPKHTIPPSAFSPFTFVLSENVFRQGMVVLLNLVYVLLSGMLYVYKSDVSVVVFETWWPL